MGPNQIYSWHSPYGQQSKHIQLHIASTLIILFQIIWYYSGELNLYYQHTKSPNSGLLYYARAPSKFKSGASRSGLRSPPPALPSLELMVGNTRVDIEGFCIVTTSEIKGDYGLPCGRGNCVACSSAAL